jgi:hypothetical protein
MKPIIGLLLISFLVSGCIKDKCMVLECDNPGVSVLITSAVHLSYTISGITGVGGGNVSSDGGHAVAARGIIWDTKPHPDVSLSTRTNDGTGTGSFSSLISGLKPNTQYYVRAYAANSAGIAYGNELIFTTGPTDLSDHLLLYLPFSGNPGDSSGHRNDGIVYGSTLTADRHNSLNAAYNFSTDGAGFGAIKDQIYVNHIPIYNVANITVAVWVNLAAYYWAGNPSDPNTVIINRNEGGYSSPNSQTWSLRCNSTNVNAVVCEAAPGITQNAFVLTYPTPLPLNSWTHVAFTYDATNLKIYIGGQLVATGASNLPLNTNSISGISIGQSRQANGNWNNLAGKLDEVAVWGRALSAGEIKELAEQ